MAPWLWRHREGRLNLLRPRREAQLLHQQLQPEVAQLVLGEVELEQLRRAAAAAAAAEGVSERARGGRAEVVVGEVQRSEAVQPACRL
jgi:hypothetical protein